MTDHTNKVEKVTLLLDNGKIKVNKRQLIDNSTYFQAMFRQEHFQESQMNEIRLKDVNYETFRILMTLISDLVLVIDDCHLKSVTIVANMYQFQKIENYCLEKMRQQLTEDNCLDTWTFLLAVNPVSEVCLIAKAMALTEFDTISHGSTFLNLVHDRINDYLGSVNLHVRHEIQVCNTVRQWLETNSNSIPDMPGKKALTWDQVITSLLCTVNFDKIDCDDIGMMCSNDILSSATDSLEYLKKFRLLKENQNQSEFNDLHIINNPFLGTSARRINFSPCILAHKIYARPLDSGSSPSEKRLKVNENLQRDYRNVVILNYDYTVNKFTKLCELEIGELRDFRVLAHKRFIVTVGGTYKKLGNGSFSRNFNCYDTYHHTSTARATMNHDRTLFRAYVYQEKMFLIGGLMQYRLRRGDISIYNFKTDRWLHKHIQVPIDKVMLDNYQCCCTCEGLLLLSLFNKKAFFINGDTFDCRFLKLIDKDGLILEEMQNYALFFYNNYIYARGKYLLKMEKVDTVLQILERESTTIEFKIERAEAVVCRDNVFIMYTSVSSNTISIEKYDMKSNTSEFVFKNISSTQIIQINGEDMVYRVPNNSLFSYFHYNSLKRDEHVNPNLTFY